ncbi:MAG: gliding motility-associated C-terminal domain-containing protein, partial [Bacteroidota bacterium]
MKKRIALAGLGWLFSLAAYATHIVGGEIELQHIQNNQYRLRLIQYFDNFYGEIGAEDDAITVTIFAKATGAAINSYILPKTEVTFVPYTNQDCAIGELSTKRIIYEAQVTLNVAQFSDPEGYYVIWERCCRNRVINNIVLPSETGQTFFM